jgi:hypothetical protein
MKYKVVENKVKDQFYYEVCERTFWGIWYKWLNIYLTLEDAKDAIKEFKERENDKDKVVYYE